MNKEKKHTRFTLICVVLMGAIFRFSGLDWDRGQHLNPDERYISMVVSSLSTPKSLSDYLDPNRSPLSPYTHGFGSYIYGQFPISALTYLGVLFNMHDYSRNYLLGRTVSATLDIGSIALIFLLGARLWNKRVGLLGSFFYASAPLAIQYAHFMVTESWMVFSWLITLLAILKWDTDPSTKRSLAVGAFLGVSLAIKASSILIVPLIIVMVLCAFWKRQHSLFQLFNHGTTLTILAILAILFFRFFQPTIFQSASWLDWSLRPDFYQAFEFQQRAIEGKVMFPPQWQWVGTQRWWFPMTNLFMWGLGPVIGSLAMVGIVISIAEIFKGPAFFKKAGPSSRLVLAIFVLAIFFWQGGKFVKVMRYFLPLFPLFALFAASTVFHLKRTVLIRTVLGGSVVFSGLWALMFTSIYRTTTTRIAASEWMYQNIPSGSKVMLEEWDDPLPLALPGYPSGNYISAMEPVYAPDDEKKNILIDEWIQKYNWIVLSSPRAKGSIGKLPQQFPLMARFYNDLESGTLGFVKTAEFTSYPKLEIGNWKLEINDSFAEESFWVYDHPTVEIYQKARS